MFSKSNAFAILILHFVVPSLAGRIGHAYVLAVGFLPDPDAFILEKYATR